MYDQQLLRQLQSTWPETADYLTRIGQTTNDLMVLRELRQVEPPSESILELLGYDDEDLLKIPAASTVLRFLYSRNEWVRSAAQIPGYRELWEEHETENKEYGGVEEFLETNFVFDPETDLRVWALPELQEKLTTWAATTAARYQPETSTVTLTQATILMLTALMLEQEHHSDALAAECWLYVLSSSFYAKAGSPTP